MNYIPSQRPLMAGYVGGKMRLARRIVAMIPPHEIYLEPFCGAAWVLFRKERSRLEVISDINGELVNLYRVARENTAGLARLFAWTPISRAEFDRLKDMSAAEVAKLDAVTRAWRFYYLFALSFGGKIKHMNFSMRHDRVYARADFPGMGRRLLQIRERLGHVVLENMDFASFIPLYDRKGAFFYCDPPYLGSEDYYGRGAFDAERLEELAEILGGLRGKFLLSINDCPKAREIFAGFRIQSAEVIWSINDRSRTRARELLVTNYDIGGCLNG